MITSAGIVKIVPAAIDEAAEAPVATMLFSRMLERPIRRSTPMETTAAGIAVATVSPGEQAEVGVRRRQQHGEDQR